MSAPTLFPTAPLEVRPPQTDTQRRAHRPTDRQTLRAAVRAALLRHPDGITDWELTEFLGLPERDKPSVGKRRQECKAIPVYVRVGDERRVMTRPSPTGSPCTVWTIRGAS